MKLILSRKGIDSSNGRRPSPIITYGKMTSLQIPVSNSPTTFYDIYVNGRKINGNKYMTLNSVGRGQEFLLDTKYYPDVKSWIKELFG